MAHDQDVARGTGVRPSRPWRSAIPSNSARGGPPKHPACGRGPDGRLPRRRRGRRCRAAVPRRCLPPGGRRPDLFDEVFGVVLAFHPISAGLRHLGPLSRHPHAPGPCRGGGGCAETGGGAGSADPPTGKPNPGSWKERDFPRRASSATTCMRPDFSTRSRRRPSRDCTSSSTCRAAAAWPRGAGWGRCGQVLSSGTTSL